MYLLEKDYSDALINIEWKRFEAGVQADANQVLIKKN